MTLTSAHLPGWCSPEAVYCARDTLMEMYSLPAWAKQGLCRGYPQSVFFPAKGQPSAPAKRICQRCPVIGECRDYALSVPGLEGVWGGLSKQERRHRGKIVSSGSA